jgi:hypothetical protein
MRRMRNAYKIIVGKLVKRPLGTSRRRWEDIIKMYSKEIVCGYRLDSSGSG